MKYSLRTLMVVAIVLPLLVAAYWESFSIRDLFLVALVVAMALGWVMDHRRQAAEIDRLRKVDPLPTSQAPAQNPPKD